MDRGKFITLEGIDGAGKSTHLAWLRSFLVERGKDVIVTREPGGTPLGEKLRALLLSEAMQPATEVLLMFAARAEHLQTVIEPALAHGTWVVSDRFTDASYAYQAGGRGVPDDKLRTLEHWLQGDLQPDLTLLFDVPVEISQRRLTENDAATDRFEQEKADFFARVRSTYLSRAAASAGRIKVVDSTQAITDIQNLLEEIVIDCCFK